jgi:hypothetical protein
LSVLKYIVVSPLCLQLLPHAWGLMDMVAYKDHIDC